MAYYDKEKPKPFIQLSVKLTDDSFETQITLPIDATAEQRKNFIQAWFSLMDSALAVAKAAPNKSIGEK